MVEQILLAGSGHQPKPRGFPGVKQSDQRERGHAVRGAQPGVGDERRQVHGKHGDVEAAHEVTPKQQMEPPLAHRLAQRSPQRLPGRHGDRAAGKRRGERHDERRQPGHHQKRDMPVEAADQELRHRKQRELPEGARSRGHAERRAALLRATLRPMTASTVAMVAPATPLRRATRGEMHREGRLRERHAGKAEHIKRPARGDDPAAAVAVGDCARYRAERAPHDLLQGEREGQHLPAPAELQADRLQVQAEAGARPEAEEKNETTAEEH
jgi:hypothetical protein